MKEVYWVIYYNGAWRVHDNTYDREQQARQRAIEMIDEGEASTVHITKTVGTCKRTTTWDDEKVVKR